MTFWIDAQLPPAIAMWIEASFGIRAQAVRELGMARAKDSEIFQAARQDGMVVVSKDEDFVELVNRLGAPPQVLWITCGNTTNSRLQEIFAKELPRAITLLESGEPLVEIGDAP